ncbi:hypothetical protein [Streptomyces sp. Tue6028]|uniref:hypothetical protein n=1 Tax=Streptomyces sp. Tue6028 TaxID=2036037 RepID=UPI003D71E98D
MGKLVSGLVIAAFGSAATVTGTWLVGGYDSPDGKNADERPSAQITEVKHVRDGKVVLSGTIRNVSQSASLWSFVKDSNGNYFPNYKVCTIEAAAGTWACPELRLAARGAEPDDSTTVYVALVNGVGGQKIAKYQMDKASNPKAALDGLPEGSTTLAEQRGIR